MNVYLVNAVDGRLHNLFFGQTLFFGIFTFKDIFRGEVIHEALIDRRGRTQYSGHRFMHLFIVGTRRRIVVIRSVVAAFIELFSINRVGVLGLLVEAGLFGRVGRGRGPGQRVSRVVGQHC